MAGISITLDVSDLDAAIARFGPIVSVNGQELMDIVGAVGESQTRRRITDEKAAPNGTPWPENRAKTPTLHQTGRNLLDSVAFVSTHDTAEWGATWEHADVHQFGAVILPRTGEALQFKTPDGRTVYAKKVTIPARPFVGLSDDNRAEIIDVTTDFLAGLAEGATS